ncbi:MAG: hypothetical protein R3E32_24060 [Chitinophagales bacterium]
MFQQIANKMTLNPRRMFLIDGFGALLSALLLGVVLVRFENYFGMSPKALYRLCLIACVFAAYDFSCYVRNTENWRPYLKAIAIANLIYCCFSIGLVFYHYQNLTNLGLTYFLLELAVVMSLISIELKVASK